METAIAHLYVALFVKLPFTDASASELHTIACRKVNAPATRNAAAPDASAKEGYEGSLGISVPMKPRPYASMSAAANRLVPA